MQPIAWYASRLRSMSLPEIAWRVRSALQNAADKRSLRRGGQTPGFDQVVEGKPIAGTSGLDSLEADLFRSSVFPKHWQTMGVCAAGAADGPDQRNEGGPRGAWVDRARTQAESIRAGRLPLFDLEDCFLGQPIQWNRDHKFHVDCPVTFAHDIDYRDHREVGDCKFVWEPSRHHQLVTLGRAWRLTGDASFAEAVVEQIEGWIEQCPYGFGMQWRSPLELAIRMINWVWSLELIRDWEGLTEDGRRRIAVSMYQHLRDITRKYSRYSSANNHLIGEAAGVYVAASHMRGLRGGEAMRARAKQILHEEIVAQTFADGGNREQALGYHVFVLQFFLLAGWMGRNDGDAFDRTYWEMLEKMFDYVSAFVDGGRLSPVYGDADDGYVLDLGRRLSDPRALLCVGAVLFDRADFKRQAGSYREAAWWFFGEEGRRAFDRLDDRSDGAVAGTPNSRLRAFPETGYYILGTGAADSAGAADAADVATDSGSGAASSTSGAGPRRVQPAVRVVVDCGPLGFKSIAAHGHADALSLTLNVGGVEVLVDPGTYDYFSHGAWRAYFRSTRAHNTAVVDGRDQSEQLGLFLWGSRAEATCIEFTTKPDGTRRFVGRHNGYERLTDPVIHCRMIELAPDGSCLVVTDEFRARGPHEVDLCWHFGPDCRVATPVDQQVEVAFPSGRMTMRLDDASRVSRFVGSEDPIFGWTSQGYHRKTPAPTIVARRSIEGTTTVTTRLTIETGVGGSVGRDGGERRAGLAASEKPAMEPSQAGPVSFMDSDSDPGGRTASVELVAPDRRRRMIWKQASW